MSRCARTLTWLLLGALALALPACQSTQDKAKEVQERAAELIASQVPLEIPKPNRDVTVVGTTLISDENGSAVVVEARNTTRQTLVGLPILIDVRDQTGKRSFINDAFGTEFALQHIPLMKPGETVTWVHDQILTGGDPKSVKVTIGQPASTNPPSIPEIAVSPAKIAEDPIGIVARGTATNKSSLDQKDLVVFAVVRSGGEIVAAGRAGFKNLKATGKPSNYNIYFFGDPTGGDVEIAAPPAVFD